MIPADKRSRYVDVASHAIGLDHSRPYKRHGKRWYKPYRNYFSTASYGPDYELWKTLESAGYAKSRTSERGSMFWLTRDGLDWLGDQIGVHIYNEEY